MAKNECLSKSQIKRWFVAELSEPERKITFWSRGTLKFIAQAAASKLSVK